MGKTQIPSAHPSAHPSVAVNGSKSEVGQTPFACKYCGAPSWVDPSDQLPPPDYCHEGDHGDADEAQPEKSTTPP